MSVITYFDTSTLIKMVQGNLSNDKVYAICNHNFHKIIGDDLPKYAKQKLIHTNHIYHKIGQEAYGYLDHAGVINHLVNTGHFHKSKTDKIRLTDLRQLNRLCHVFMKLSKCTSMAMHGDLSYFNRMKFYADTYAKDFKLYNRRINSYDSSIVIPDINPKDIPVD